MINKMTFRYVKAFFDVCEDNKKLKEVVSDFEFLQKEFLRKKKLRDFFENIAVLESEKTEMLFKAFGKIFCEETKRFVRFLCFRKRISFIAPIVSAFLLFYEQKKGIVRGEVFSVNSLAESIRKKIKSGLEKGCGKQVELSFFESSELIGGICLKMGNTVYDASIKNALKRVEHVLVRTT